jgi:chromosome segregation ATPase
MSDMPISTQYKKLQQTKHRHQLKLARAQHRQQRQIRAEERLKLRMAALLTKIGWDHVSITELENRLRCVKSRLTGTGEMVADEETRQKHPTHEPDKAQSPQTTDLPQAHLERLLAIGNLCLSLQLDRYPTDNLMNELQSVNQQINNVQ